MIEIFQPKKSSTEAIAILIIVFVVALVYNIFSPKGVSIIYEQPKQIEIPDSVLLTKSSYDTSLYQTVSLAQLHRLIRTGSAVIIDARNPEAYQKGHIPNAINIPFQHMFDYLSTLITIPTDTLIVIYCEGKNCDLSFNLAKAMKEMNFKRIFIYHDGIEGWRPE